MLGGQRFTCVVGGLLLVPVAALAQPSAMEQIPYQGHLEASGEAEDGPFDFRFEIVDGQGAVLWTDTFPAVQVQRGAFGVNLGSGVGFPAGLWQRELLYLQIQVKPTGPGAFTSLQGRQQLLAVPFAERSSQAKDFVVTGALQVGSGVTVVGDVAATGQVSAASQQLTGALQVGGPAAFGSSLSVQGDQSVQGDLSVGGRVLARGRHDSATFGPPGAVTTSSWDIDTRRYRLTIDNSFASRSQAIPQEVVEALCGDEDGCRVTTGMSGWTAAAGQTKAVVQDFMSYDVSTGRYRIQALNAASNVEMFDGDSVETNLTGPWSACYLLDYNYALGAQDDNSRGLFLHWSTAGYNTTTKTCFVIFED